MTLLLTLLGLALCVWLSALYSGSETGFYSLSRTRLEADLHAGERAARRISRLVRDERGLLVTILIGNNLMLEFSTGLAARILDRDLAVPDHLREVVLGLVLTPVLFVAAELVPKDLFRRRPHTLVGAASPVLMLSRWLFLPLAVPLRAFSRLLERSIGLPSGEFVRPLGRERVLELLAEGARSGAIPPHAQVLAQNVLALRSIPIQAVLVPWSKVRTIQSDEPRAAWYRRVGASDHTRLPVVDRRRGVVGYVHQLEVLASAPRAELATLVRPLLTLPPELPVDQALRRLRLAGQRMALVGDPASPLGLVTLKDLVETISGDLGDW